MAFEYGFYNSINSDRKYNAIQFGQIFDGIINDGVFLSIGEKFATLVSSGMDVTVGTGKAWFNHTWNLNTTKIPITLSASHPVLGRYDAIVLEINESPDVSGRVNSIKLLKGEPSSNPVKPTLVNSEYIHQYPLSYIKVNAGVTSLTAADVEIMVGRDPCPYVTGILQTTDISELFNNWEGQFTIWFDNLKEQLSDNVVTNLQNQIDNCLKKEDIATQTDVDNGTAGKVITAPLLNYGLKKVEDKRRLVAIKVSTTFTVPSNAKDNKFMVLVQGGGGSGYMSGGGGGHTKFQELTLTPGSSISCTVGSGGISNSTNGTGGGTSKFGSYLTANGGGAGTYSNGTHNGGSGGSGGGGQDGSGGNGGTYGGGGGNGGNAKAVAGSGGTYGGGGGGCGATYGGGSGGTYGGNGGQNGNTGSNAPAHEPIFDRIAYMMPILGLVPSRGGHGGTGSSSGAKGGGGGGGYNGNGGNGSRYAAGGGGGYYGNGGSAPDDGNSNIYAAGGGGGFNGNGGSPLGNGGGGGGGGVDIGDGYTAGGYNGSYGYGYGAGGGYRGNGANGIILIAWEEV